MSYIPGNNLLEEAFGSISTLTCQYIAWDSKILDAVGRWVMVFKAAQEVEASIQAVENQFYVEMGLDLQMDYVNIYSNVNSNALDRDFVGDKFVLPNGDTYQVISIRSWFMMDGWSCSLCVKIEVP